MKDYEKLKETILTMEKDLAKFWDGTNSAGSRARKSLQEIKKLAQEIRLSIQEEKKKRKNG